MGARAEEISRILDAQSSFLQQNQYTIQQVVDLQQAMETSVNFQTKAV